MKILDDLTIKELEILKKDIEARFGSVYKFCQQNPHFPKSVIYQMLSGRYAGNINRQIQRIRAEIDGVDIQKHFTIAENEIFEVLKSYKCSACRLISKNCFECNNKTQKEAHAVYAYIQHKL